MAVYEFKVVPAPAKGRKARGVKGSEGRFAHALETVMNELAAEGWEFLRTETLPSEERSGLTSTSTTFRSVMVFRRRRSDDVSAFRPKLLDRPAYQELPRPTEPVQPAPDTEDESDASFLPETGETEATSLPVALTARARRLTSSSNQDENGQAAE